MHANGEEIPFVQHLAVVAPRSKPPAPPIAAEVIDRFRQCYLNDVADVVGPLYTMDLGIKPMHAARTDFVGQAVTAKAVPGDNLALFGALGGSRPGDVLVVDWRGTMTSSVNGASMLVAYVARGLEAVVVDGAVRDVAEIANLGLPLFARGVNPVAPAKREVGEVNVAVACGGVVVEPGDLVMGGEEGVVVVPRSDIDRVLAAIEPYSAPASLDDWPMEHCQSRAKQRVAQYRRTLDDVNARIGTA
jgi:4-hydroxy-4-methyl-2-oxoglutarate aldolase